MTLAGAALSPPAPTLALVAATLGAAVVLAVQRPAVDAWTALGVAPWAAVGGVLDVLAGTGAYGPALSGAFSGAGAVLGAAVSLGLTWTVVDRVAGARGRPRRTSAYLGTAGTGAALVLLLVFLLRAPVSAAGALWLVAVPTAAAAVAGVTYFAVGVRDATVLAETGGAGLLAVFGHALDGLAVVVAVDIVGRPPGFDPVAAVARATADLPATDVLGATWPYLLVKLLAVVLALSALARLTDRSRAAVALVVAAVAAAGIGPGVATLLRVAAG